MAGAESELARPHLYKNPTWEMLQRRSWLCENLYDRDAVAAVMAWVYGWDDVIDAYVSSRLSTLVKGKLASLHKGRMNRRALLRALYHFLPGKFQVHLTQERQSEGRKPIEGAGKHWLDRKGRGPFEDDRDAYTAASADDASTAMRHRRMLEADPLAFAAAVEQAVGTKRSRVEVLSDHSISLDVGQILEHEQQMLAQNLTAGLLRAFLCFGQHRAHQRLFRGDGREIKLQTPEARAARWKQLERCFVSTTYDEDATSAFVSSQTRCCKFEVIAESCYVLDVRSVTDRLERQKRYEEVHLNSEGENEYLLAPGHRFTPVEELAEKQQIVLDRWKLEADRLNVDYRQVAFDAPPDANYVRFLTAGALTAVEFRRQRRDDPALAGSALHFLDNNTPMLAWKQEWFAALPSVHMVKARFDRSLFQEVLNNRPALLPVLQTWRPIRRAPPPLAPPLVVD